MYLDFRRNGAPWPLVYGIGINVKTGEIFPAQFTDKGPDMDLRNVHNKIGTTTNARYVKR